MRTLIYIPIIHTEVDMGSVSEEVKKEYLSKYGKNKWLKHLDLISNLWETIRKRLLKMPVNYSKTRLYQDGLPVCGKELAIVKELAGMGSKNHLLLMELVDMGATLMRTEDPGLLLQEHKMIKEIVGARGKNQVKERLEEYRKHSDDLLVKRDDFIAKRISETLQDGETGILFIGALHKVDKRVPRGIRLVYLT